ncbi:nose resistant to fluoxetine protein 6 isoform X3, partial [Ixodes scapularis]
CLGHLWYINIDFQLYVALIFIPILMIRRPYLGIMIAAFATVASSAYTGIISYIMNYQPAIIFTHTDVSYTIGTANQIYFKPFSHIGPFCIGVVLGYYIYMAPKIRLSKQGSRRGVLLELALGFSIVSNTEKLLKTDPSDPADSKLQFIHGLRFYSSTWVMLGHAFLIADPTATGSLMNVVDLVEEFMTTLIANAFPSVETFLFISGFLLSYNVQKSLRNKTRLFLWVPLILLRRYIRLTVPAMFIVGIWLLVPLMADGPVLNDFKATFLDTCQRRWWSVMLHTNNFAPFLEM